MLQVVCVLPALLYAATGNGLFVPLLHLMSIAFMLVALGLSLRDARSGKIVFGDKGYEFSATLDDIEAWLDEEEAKLHGEKQ